jgi:hypothetical protein
VKRLIAVVLILAAAVLSACGTQNVQEPQDKDGKIAVRGEITTRSENPDGTLSLLVEGETQEDTEYDKARVTVDGETAVLKNGIQADTDQLQEGVLIEVETTGPVAESYPVQARASLIRILSG